MENQMRVFCSENEGLAQYMRHKTQELADAPKGLSENTSMTLNKAYLSVCSSKTPITSLKEFSQVKGVGKWILRVMKGFFENDSQGSDPENLNNKKGRYIARKKNSKGSKRYLPQKNSVAYALLITLYRGTSNGNEFMHKQELIDAAEASGLSRAPIVPEKGQGKPSQFGSSPREWYSGWSCMKTLITKGLVVKSSCPAKYMLSQEGKEAARECLTRSGPVDSTNSICQGSFDLDGDDPSNPAFDSSDSSQELMIQQHLPKNPAKSHRRGEGTSKLGPSSFHCLQEDKAYSSQFESRSSTEDCSIHGSVDGRLDLLGSQSRSTEFSRDLHSRDSYKSADSSQNSFSLRPCSSSDNCLKEASSLCSEASNVLSRPPLSAGENFEDAYEVILILDDREQFATRGSRSRRIIDNVCVQFKIKIEVRRLPVGDAIWIAHHKYLDDEYVLDFIVERKKVDDLRSSICDNRYKDQKVKLLRCGLKRIIYVVEGDANFSEAAESIKTACFTTEILEGFDVQRTSGLGDTLKKYGYLTQAITHYYTLEHPEEALLKAGVCPRFDEFIRRCQDLEKMTVSDVFATQLMQVPQVTEEVALAIIDMYPTLHSLAQAYALLDGDVRAQEEMLRKQSNNVIGALASRNIFRLVWGD
ncbi:hypothetical protein CDL15_Pgr016154 [Punica granatum]|uniref:Crossover junction endonuclease MUS81 n=1 Tax=Punica granatum TaxID=22663 RepID=A0A218X1A8_PUNGR|nr:hypothetical protein CDL15_Pgr016154 [Punica granatum]